MTLSETLSIKKPHKAIEKSDVITYVEVLKNIHNTVYDFILKTQKIYYDLTIF